MRGGGELAGSEAGRRYTFVAMTLHWVIAALILGNLVLGWWMRGESGMAQFSAYQLHKSIGVSVLLLSIGRFGWRFLSPPPPYPWPLRSWERLASHTVHIAFYAAMLIMPLSGWLMASTSPLHLPTLLFKTVPWPSFPGTGSLSTSARTAANAGSATAHLVLAWLMVALLVLHLGAVLKHLLVDRHAILRRMVPGRNPMLVFEEV